MSDFKRKAIEAVEELLQGYFEDLKEERDDFKRSNDFLLKENERLKVEVEQFSTTLSAMAPLPHDSNVRAVKLATQEDIAKLRSEFDVNLANLAKRVNKFDEHIQEVAKGLIDRFDSALAERVTASEVTKALDAVEIRLRQWIEQRIEWIEQRIDSALRTGWS